MTAVLRSVMLTVFDLKRGDLYVHRAHAGNMSLDARLQERDKEDGLLVKLASNCKHK